MLKLKSTLLACLSLLPAAGVVAAELGVGTPREEVIAQLGMPKAKMNSGAREILSYPNGRITLIDGQIVSIDWKGALPVSPTVAPWSRATAVAPPPASAAAAPVAPPAAAVAPPPVAPPAMVASPAPPSEGWLTDFAAAQTDAAATKRRLLVLFTGSDWCPPCMQFEANVAHAPDFLNVTHPAFVLVKLDYPRSAPQPAALRARNEELRQHYGVNAYPTLLVVSADGTKSARVDTTRSRQADGIVDYYVQAVDEARHAKEKSSFWPW